MALSRGLRAAGRAPVFGLLFALLGCDRGSSPAPAGSVGTLELPPPAERGELCTGERTLRRCRPRNAEASDFVCDGGLCTQRHVRLPDDGEWRCAEREGVAWCAGGEPAAGVVAVASDRGFLCGERRIPRDAPADRRRERICIDPSPDIPPGAREAYSCRFAQERGVTRECIEKPTPVRPPPARTAPDCWLDADCAPGSCDRGQCVDGGP